jgi:hypothetical protein
MLGGVASADVKFCKGNNILLWNYCYARIIYDSGNIYEGRFVKGKYSGFGVYSVAKGNQGKWRFEGEFKNGLRNGLGTLYYPNGSKYIGEYKNNQKNGNGKLISYNNTMNFKGIFKDDEPLNGIFYFSNGDRKLITNGIYGTWHALESQVSNQEFNNHDEIVNAFKFYTENNKKINKYALNNFVDPDELYPSMLNQYTNPFGKLNPKNPFSEVSSPFGKLNKNNPFNDLTSPFGKLNPNNAFSEVSSPFGKLNPKNPFSEVSSPFGKLNKNNPFSEINSPFTPQGSTLLNILNAK